MNSIIINLIITLAEAFIGSSTFARIEATVLRKEEASKTSADAALNGPDKKKAVLAELKIIGIDLAEWSANLLIELAVAKHNLNQGKTA